MLTVSTNSLNMNSNNSNNNNNNNSNNTSLEIRNDADGNLSIPGLIKEKITSLEDAMNVFERGSMNR